MSAGAVQCAVCSVQCAMCSVQFAMCSVQCAMCSVQCAVCRVQCAVCSVSAVGIDCFCRRRYEGLRMTLLATLLTSGTNAPL